MNKVQKIIHRAIELIEAGWCQRSFGSPSSGCYCAVGAINQAALEIFKGRAATYRQKLPYWDQRDAIIAWNDDRSRTKAQVLKVLRRALLS